MLFLSCKANARVKFAKSGHGQHLFRIIICVVLVILLCYGLYAVLLLLCCTVIVLLLLFVLSYVLIVCTVPLPPGVNPIAVDKYTNKLHFLNIFSKKKIFKYKIS